MLRILAGNIEDDGDFRRVFPGGPAVSGQPGQHPQPPVQLLPLRFPRLPPGLIDRLAGGDPRVVSGESGAVTAGLAATLLSRREAYREIVGALGFDESSVVLCFSTEGATDRENYRRVTGEAPWED